MLGNVYCSLFYIPRLNMLCLELRKCRFPVLRFFLSIRTFVNVRKKNASLENSF